MSCRLRRGSLPDRRECHWKKEVPGAKAKAKETTLAGKPELALRGFHLFPSLLFSETDPTPTVPNIVMLSFSRSRAVSRPVMSPHAIAAEPGRVLLHTKNHMTAPTHPVRDSGNKHRSHSVTAPPVLSHPAWSGDRMSPNKLAVALHPDCSHVRESLAPPHEHCSGQDCFI